METSLRFAGDWSALAGTAVAVGLGVAMWLLYFRESYLRTDARRWILPTLRGMVVFLVAWILVGPVLHHEQAIRKLGRLYVFLDSSRSMDLTDPEMPLRRKIAALRTMNLLPDDDILDAAEAASTQVAENRQLNRSLLAMINENQTSQFRTEAARYLTNIDAAYKKQDALLKRIMQRTNGLSTDSAGTSTTDAAAVTSATENARIDRMQRLRDAEQLRQQTSQQIKRAEQLLKAADIPPPPWRTLLQQLEELGQTIDASIVDAVQSYAMESSHGTYASSIGQFDSMTRWDRALRMLLDTRGGTLHEIAKDHDIEFFALRDGQTLPLWWQRRGGKKSSGPMPKDLIVTPNGMRTDLAETLAVTLGEQSGGAGVLLLSDGQHNALGASPLTTSRLLGERGVPIFTVGMGATRAAQDMGLLGVDGPTSVQADDVVRGELVLDDQMAAGAEYQLKIRFGDLVLWEQTIASEQSGNRRIAFSFPVKSTFQAIAKTAEESRTGLRSAPAEFDVSVLATDPTISAKEKIADNNHLPMIVRIVTQNRKLLILDGRSRWETRYLRNTFQRQPQWDVHCFDDGLMLDRESAQSANNPWRHSSPTAFPASRDDFFQYDLIVIGDLPSNLLTDQEIQWIHEFVENRGGGLVFLDGRRGHLANADSPDGSPFGDLLPVRFDGDHQRDLKTRSEPAQWTLTDAGAERNALRLVGTDEKENDSAWRSLPPAQWVAPAVALPGAVTCLEFPDDQGKIRPVLTFRPFGAGRVLFAGSDEFWRWRYQVGDRFHQKFWMQIANWIASPPYAVDGEHVSIGMDQTVCEPRSAVSFHVALRDDDGKPVIRDDLDLYAVLYRDGRSTAKVPLQADGNQSGIFRGRSGPLAAGRYQIRVQQHGFGSTKELPATAELMVKDTLNREIVELGLNRQLLQSMAISSKGAYFDEEQIGGLTNVIHRMDQKEVIRSETSLWDSWWWFVPIIGLLSVEWILRKKAGYV